MLNWLKRLTTEHTEKNWKLNFCAGNPPADAELTEKTNYWTYLNWTFVQAIHQQMLNQLNGTASPRSSAVQSPVPNANGGLDLGPLPQVKDWTVISKVLNKLIKMP
jgi:hypothetical protein